VKVKANSQRKVDLPEAAFGLRAHSGWAALVVLGTHDRELQVLRRCRLNLVDEEWARQPYHAAEELEKGEARKVVKRGIDQARKIALRELRVELKRTRQSGFDVRACALLVGEPMPDWSVDEILAVHFRMHKAEGVLFRDVLARAAAACDLTLVPIPEKSLLEQAEAVLAAPADDLLKRVTALGKAIGSPWGKDQKDAALAALIALEGKREAPKSESAAS